MKTKRVAWIGMLVALAMILSYIESLIPVFVAEWEKGHRIVSGIKSSSKENGFIYFLRSVYYKTIKNMSDVQMIEHFTGFGLYDKVIVDILRENDDSYPYLRGQICDIGFEKAFVKFNQPLRKCGITKNNFYTLYDNAMLGIVKHSKVPLRIMTFIGFLTSFLSITLAVIYFILKLLFCFYLYLI